MPPNGCVCLPLGGKLSSYVASRDIYSPTIYLPQGDCLTQLRTRLLLLKRFVSADRIFILSEL